MGDVYDFKSKKKIDQPRSPSYRERFRQCLEKAQANGYCDCDICKDKIDISNKYYDILTYLCKDYEENTGKDLYLADALEIALIVSLRLKNDILKKD